MRTLAPLSICLAAALGGCVSGNGRHDGVTTGAGNAIAANTVMQMVDPWPRGVEDTDLVTPVERSTAEAASGSASSGSAASSTGDN